MNGERVGGGGRERLTVGHGKCSLAVDLRLDDDEVNGEGDIIIAFAARPDARTRARRTLPQNAFTRI